MKGRILTSLLAVMAMASLQAQEVPAVPRLVVGLTIDQLRMDYIEAFSALYGDGDLNVCGRKVVFIGMWSLIL